MNAPIDENDQSFRDKIATVDKQGKRVWVYPHQPSGKLYNIRTIVTLVYLAVFFTLPFIKVDGHPIFMINVLKRQFILFGQIFWPQDFFIFGLSMVVFIVFIALFTVVFGRIFCGWACPQTIFMEMIFRRIEYWIEGDGAQQKLLNKGPWNFDKTFKKVTKWIVFWAISFLIANTFLAYLIGIDDLRATISAPLSESMGTLTSLAIFTTVFFFVFLWLREQVCTVICPYGRMQGVLLDKNSIIVAYDYKRGEPRGKFKKNEQRSAGDCIDCEQCVKVCPTSIDIRNGTQLECTNCTACIDACNHMMKAVGLPTGLIRYASENSISTKVKSRFTARMKAYTVVMFILLGVLSYLLFSRTDVGITILRTPGQLFQKQPNHHVSNVYNYKLLNKTFKNKELEFKPDNFNGEIRLVGTDKLHVIKNGYTIGTMFILLDSADVAKRKTQLKIGVFEDGKKIKTITTSFLGPFAFN
jgi:cytochrome c oxidase accessory protein FixG